MLTSVLAAMMSLQSKADATSPPLEFVGPHMLVIHVRIVSSEKEYLRLASREEVQSRIVEYARAELMRASLDIPVFDRDTFQQPDNVYSDWILWMDCRVDIATHLREDGTVETLGAVTVELRRGETRWLSGEPLALFAMKKGSPELTSFVDAATKDAVDRSVLKFIVQFN